MNYKTCLNQIYLTKVCFNENVELLKRMVWKLNQLNCWILSCFLWSMF